MNEKTIEFSSSLSASDVSELAELVGQAWTFDEYSAEDARRAAEEKYLLGHLKQCTIFFSAKINGSTAGFIAGRLPGIPRIPFAEEAEMLMKDAEARLSASSTEAERKEWERDWLCASDWYEEKISELGEASANAAWIDLFIVGASARGSGVGGRLYKLFEKKAEEHNRKNGILLKTDSWCSWGFYEKKGFARLAEFACSGELEGGAYYLYGRGIGR